MSANANEVSLLLEPFTIRPLTPEQAGVFDSPLFISGIFICYEVVFWSPTWGMWIYLVSGHTTRLFPPETRSREVTVSELPWYEAEARRLGLVR